MVFFFLFWSLWYYAAAAAALSRRCRRPRSSSARLHFLPAASVVRSKKPPPPPYERRKWRRDLCAKTRNSRVPVQYLWARLLTQLAYRNFVRSLPRRTLGKQKRSPRPAGLFVNAFAQNGTRSYRARDNPTKTVFDVPFCTRSTRNTNGRCILLLLRWRIK